MSVAATAEVFDPSMKDYESHFINSGNIRTHYIEAGKGKPLVLVHGGGPGADSYGNWHSCIPIFARSYRTIAVDMLGFGKTDKPDPKSFVYSQDARTEHMAGFLEALDAGPVTLIGNSMGGLTSLSVAVTRPDLVSALILMGPAAIRTQLPPALAPLLNFDGTPEGMRRVIGALTNKNYAMDDTLLQYRLGIATQPETRSALAAAMHWVKERKGLYADEEFIKQNRVPTLIVGGKDDPIITPEQIFRLLNLIEDSWGYIIPHCGHWVMMEEPKQFTSICQHFLSR